MHEKLENLAHAARLVEIRTLLAFFVEKGFKLHKIDVKSAFLNGVLEEEVYVRQPPGFVSEKYPHRVYKLRKVLYGLKQTPRAWYGKLRGFLFEQGFEMGKVDQTFFLLRQGKDILIVQVYVDDIVFCGSSNSFVARFAEDMSREFEVSMMGELKFFLGLQIKQSKEGTFVHQAKYTKDIVRTFKIVIPVFPKKTKCKPICMLGSSFMHIVTYKCIQKQYHLRKKRRLSEIYA
jgi:hypothetical protein